MLAELQRPSSTDNSTHIVNVNIPTADPFQETEEDGESTAVEERLPAPPTVFPIAEMEELRREPSRGELVNGRGSGADLEAQNLDLTIGRRTEEESVSVSWLLRLCRSRRLR